MTIVVALLALLALLVAIAYGLYLIDQWTRGQQ